MASDLRERGRTALDHLSENQLPAVVRWLELLVNLKQNWSLTPKQMLFPMQNHNAIETAFENENLEFLRQLAATPEFKTLFGDMGFDEAYDRYETTLEIK